MTNKQIFNTAKKYLLDCGAPEDLLLDNITFRESDKPKTKSELYRSMLESAKSKQGMPNVIGDLDKLKQSLCDFDPDKVLKNYNEQVGYEKWGDIFDVIKHNSPPSGKMDKNDKHSCWVNFCKSCLSIAFYLKRFPDIKAFYRYVDPFIKGGNDMCAALPLIIKEEIFGYQFALACDFIKDNISPLFVKPDVHIKEIFKGLGISEKNASDYQIFRDVINFSEDIHEAPYTVDRVFWTIGGKALYKDRKVIKDIKIKSSKKEFIELVSLVLNPSSYG